MAEETEVRDEPVVENGANPFTENAWKEIPIQDEPKAEDAVLSTQNDVDKKEEPAVLLQQSEWWKELEFESADDAKAKVSELKKLKETPPTKEEAVFANEQSKLAYNALINGDEDVVFNILDEKRKLQKYTSVEINESNAVDIVKLAMQHKYKDLKPDEIDYKFNKQFTAGREPKQGALEDDDTFLERKTEWDERVAELKKDLVIEAKLLKPELEKIKSELVLPIINKGDDPAKLQAQKDVEAAELDKRRVAYLQSLNSDYKKFNGFETVYKNEDVGIPETAVSFAVTDEQKSSLKNELESFDLDAFVLGRWFNENGSPNVSQLMEDVYLLRNKKDILQKLTFDTGNKVLENYIKIQKNISVDGGSKGKLDVSENKDDKDKAAAFFFASEKTF